MDDSLFKFFVYHQSSSEIGTPLTSLSLDDQPGFTVFDQMRLGSIPETFHPSDTMNCVEADAIVPATIERYPIRREGQLSAEGIIRIAAANFIELSDRFRAGRSVTMQPLSLSGLTPEQIENVNLASILLAAAENVRIKRFGRARNLLFHLYDLCSTTGNPVQRIAYYFAHALQERIDRQMGRQVSTKRRKGKELTPQAAIKSMLMGNPSQLVLSQKVPFSRLMVFTSIQTILETIATEKRIHVVDLSIRQGIHWAVLMQALASRSACPIEFLKISANGVCEELIATTGRSLTKFAETLRLPFEFKAVIVEDMLDLKEEMFKIEDGETVCIYSFIHMNTLVVRPHVLENLVGVLHKLKPCIMTIADVEGNHNSSSFIFRFTESLFYHGAFMDCLDTYMDRNDYARLVTEQVFVSQSIRSVVSYEGKDRVVRHVGVDKWRSFFKQFRVIETELGQWSEYQAGLLQQFAHGSLCTIEKNAKSLTVGWKGSPLIFISAWKFLEEEPTPLDLNEGY